MAPYFITGNPRKFSEAKSVLPRIEHICMNITEIQSMHPQEIIEAKLQEARKYHLGDLVVEDVSLTMECMAPFPGPLIKWYLKHKGIEWLASEAKLHNLYGAEAICMIGYAMKSGGLQYFEGKVKGTIVEPRDEARFGWDPIFLPDGHAKTFSQMTPEEKNAISHRSIAFHKLKEYLELR